MSSASSSSLAFYVVAYLLVTLVAVAAACGLLYFSGVLLVRALRAVVSYLLRIRASR